jgi:hypothetical protein
MDTLVAVLGTLAGTIVGSTATCVSQRAQYRRESDERLRDARRLTYVRYLGLSHDVFVEIRRLASEGRSARFPGHTRLDMRTVPAPAAQSALEELRLLSDDQVAESAAQLWAHLRKRGIPQGEPHSGSDWSTWGNAYWLFRRQLIDSCRRETGMSDLDWTRVGVTDPPSKEPPESS